MVYSFINLNTPYALRFKPPEVCFDCFVILLWKSWQSWVSNGYDVNQLRKMGTTTRDDKRDLALLCKSWQSWVSNGYDYVDQLRKMWTTTRDDKRDLAPLISALEHKSQGSSFL